MLPTSSRAWVPLVLLGLAACDLRNPAGSPSAIVAVEGTPGTRAEAALIGTYSVPTAMPVPDTVTSDAEPAPTGIALEPDSYVLLRIGGTLRAERNPYLVGTRPGEGAITYTAVQSSEATLRGATSLWLLGRGGSWVPPEGGEYLTGYFRPHADGRDLVLLVRVGAAPVDLWAARDKLPGKQLQGWYCFEGAPYCQMGETGRYALPGENNGAYIENYWLTQSHTVTATRISEPLAVDGPDVVAPGSTARFAAAPWSDLRLRDGIGRPPNFWWIWTPGDTTSAPPRFRPEIVCSGRLRTTCDFEPKQSGRLRVQTYVEGAVVEYARIVRVQQQRLRLTCPGTVQRGATMQCTVAAVPSGTLDSVRWTFADSVGHTVTDSTGRSSWGGTMVVGGRMEVSARISGETQRRTDTATVIVTPRNWSGRMPYPTALPREEVDPSRFPRLPVTIVNGYDQWIRGALGQYEWGIDWFGRFQPITSGPNEGFWFLREPPAWSEPVVYLSGHLQPGHPSRFYEAQAGRRPGEGNPARGYSGWCTQADMNALLDEVRDHEGSVAGPRLSHHDFNVQYTAQHDPGPALEGLVLRPAPSDNFTRVAEAAVGNAYETALETANNAAVHAGSNLYTVSCKVHQP